MDDLRMTRLVQTALRCYPARWQRRHGDEAAELAALLIRDGTPAGSVAWSYLAGAVREWLTPRPSGRLRTVACALLVAACSLGLSAGLLASAGPARAATPGPARTSPARAATPSPASATPGPASAHAQCRPGSPEPVPVAIAAVGRPHMITWVAGHGRSC